LSSQSSPIVPSADQLAATRIAQWHQNGEALLTFENLRSWINAAGIALFTPRPQQLPCPAPSMVEGVLGAPNSAPTIAETELSRSLLARLIADNAAVPLNLLGSPTATGTEVPDYIVSTAVFPYIFTLRGDKAWKQPPATSGATKVSPLALASYNLLIENGATSAYDLVTQLGKEVTEAAVLRSLTELWQHLRVLPVPQPDGAATLWELTSTRFTKQMKSGSNAGQPTALSALISLYLGQSIVATEEEIETFLSPLAARSRVRDVIHALLGARHLDTIAIEGKTVLHVSGSFPAFITPATAEAPQIEPVNAVESEEASTPDGDLSPSRIKKFIPTPRKIGTGYVNKSARKSEGSAPSNRERRPFTRESNRPDRPSFTKPWAEEQADKLKASQESSATPQAEGSSHAGERPSRTYSKPSSDRPFKRTGFGSKPSFERKPSFGSRPSFSDRPRSGSDRDSRPPRREYSSRSDASSSAPRDFAPRKSFSKFDGPSPRREGGFSGKPSFGSKPAFGRDNDTRPSRGGFAAREGTRPASSFGAKSDFTPRKRSASPDRERPTYRKFDAPRFDKPRFDKPRADRPARSFDSDRPVRPFSSDRPGRREGGSAGFVGKPSFGAKKPYGKSSGAGFSGKSSGYEGKPSNGFAGKKPFGSSGGYKGKSSSGFAGKPASTFDKFKGNKKPFGKRAPARKFKPEEEKSGE
jgi:hypothetical protein